MTKNHAGYLPADLTRPFNLTLSCNLDDLTAFLSSLGTYPDPIKIRRLSILHSFAPEYLCDSVPLKDLVDALDQVQPEELRLEWYAGEPILDPKSLDDIGDTWRRPTSKALGGSSRSADQLGDELEERRTAREEAMEWWRYADSLATDVTQAMLEKWKGCLKDLHVRASWLGIQTDVSFPSIPRIMDPDWASRSTSRHTSVR